MGTLEFCCCDDCCPPRASPVPLRPPSPGDQRLVSASVTESVGSHHPRGRGCQCLAGAGRHSSSLTALPPPATGYSLSPYCFLVLLAPVKAHSDFRKTEQRKVWKCRGEFSRQPTESLTSTPHSRLPQNLGVSHSFFFLHTPRPHPPGSHNSSIQHNRPFPTKQLLPCTASKSLRAPPR